MQRSSGASYYTMPSQKDIPLSIPPGYPRTRALGEPGTVAEFRRNEINLAEG
jgi:hypothetical protein